MTDIKNNNSNSCSIIETVYNTSELKSVVKHSQGRSKSELISFKIAVNEAAETYGFPRSTAAFHVLNTLRDYNEKGQLKHELSELNFQKYVIDRFCSSRTQVIMALMIR